MPDAPPRALRVLHWPTDVGGHPGGLAQAERSIGLDSTVAVIARGPFGYLVDIDLDLGARTRLNRLAGRTGMLMRAVREFDVVHLNFAQAFWPRVGSFGLDLPLLRQAGKRIVVTLQGCDARLPERCPVCCDGRGPCSLHESRRRSDAVAYAARHASAVFCLNPDLLDSAPGSVFMPYASIDPRVITPRAAARGSGPLRVVHAPTNRVTKGTEAVIRACQQLGDRVELVLVEGVTRDEALKVYSTADVVVDQLRLGWYGGLSVEAMALGKPVVCRLDAKLLGRVPEGMADEVPIVSADETRIEAALDELAKASPADLVELGAQGRRFVERWHDPVALARWVAQHYRTGEPLKAFAPA
jgi:hypothetical protein